VGNELRLRIGCVPFEIAYIPVIQHERVGAQTAALSKQCV
jgi:hypothetical protein